MQENVKKKIDIDERLFQRILQEDKDAFRELYELTYRVLYAFLLSLTENAEDAQDLLQDTYIQILKNIGAYKEQGKPMAWMMKIAKNLFLMKYRKDHHVEMIDYNAVEHELGFEEMKNVEARIMLENMFKILSEEERNLIIMHDLSGLKHKEIATILELPIGTVLARYNRSIKKLRKVGMGKAYE